MPKAIPSDSLRVLGIETSCDETGVAIFDRDQGVLAEALHSQVATHEAYGGVVPELASRDHIRKAQPLIQRVLSDAGLTARDLDGIAYTMGPGLAGALLVGATLGRALAWALDIPALGIHHMEGHLLSPMLGNPELQPPFLALLVSGGHSQLVCVGAIGEYRILGDCLDDAAGEAFDKTAKLLELGYPGGPALAKLAEKGRPEKFQFPLPMIGQPGLDFSFSGLKTHVLRTVRECEADNSLDEQTRADIALAFQEAVVKTMIIKCRRAVAATGVTELLVAGGVSANRSLREGLSEWGRSRGVRVHFPELQYCTDNGAMIAYAGCLRLAAGACDGLSIEVRAKWPVTELSRVDTDPGTGREKPAVTAR